MTAPPAPRYVCDLPSRGGNALSDTDQRDLLKQLSVAWEAAQRQLAELRSQVERTTELAQAKLQSNFLERDRDKALLELGSKVWALVREGRLGLPSALDASLAAVEEAQRRQDSQSAEITHLLQEAEVPLPSVGAKKPKSAVALRDKKR